MAILNTTNNSNPALLRVEGNGETEQKKEKSVSFQFVPCVQEHIHLSDIQDDERERAWHTSLDFDRIQNENRETLDRMAQGEYTNSSEYCSRGLVTSIGRKICEKHRTDALEEVLEYQLLHQEDGVDPERLAEAYSKCTIHSARIARLMARIDTDFIDSVEMFGGCKNHKPEMAELSILETLEMYLCYMFENFKFSVSQCLIEWYD